MRNSQKLSGEHTKAIIAASIIVVLVAAGVITYLYFLNKTKSAQSDINYNPPTPEEQATGDNIKQQDGTGSDPAPQPTPPATPSETRSTVGMDITALNQSSDLLYIRTLIQTVTSSGTCSLTMAGPAGKSYSATANIQAGPSSSTCQGFNVPLSSLSSGVWSVTVSFQNNALKGSTSKDVTIND